MSREFKEPCALKRAAAAERTRKSRAKRVATETPEERKERLSRKHSYDRKYLYGVTMEEVAEYLAAQGGKCKICETALCLSTLGSRGRAGKPHVDHCHATGAYRGILCHGCNVGIGMFRDNPLALSNAINYLGATQ